MLRFWANMSTDCPFYAVENLRGIAALSDGAVNYVTFGQRLREDSFLK